MTSAFRRWFEEYLRPLNGRRVEWPQLIRRMFYEELRELRERGIPYSGEEVFIDRDQRAWGYQVRTVDQHREDLCVYRLYRHAHEHNEGALTVQNEFVWLVTCKVPNQGRFGTRCADLVGIRQDGSLVVFECKVGTNRKDSPIFALLEGMDYLGHLLLDQNFARFSQGLETWRLRHGQDGVRSRTPPIFAEVAPVLSARHSVVVLAPQEYYDFHKMDAQEIHADWHLLSDRNWPDTDRAVDLDFWVYSFPVEPFPDDPPPITTCMPLDLSLMTQPHE